MGEADSTDSVKPVIPAYLGWRNAEDDGISLRLYATDDGDAPRWDERWLGGRVAERAVIERFGPNSEGDRYLVVRVGNRFTTDDDMTRITNVIESALAVLAGFKP